MGERSTSRTRYFIIKRLLDVWLSGTALAAGSPLLLGVLAAQICVHGWPPFFTQPRPGKGGRVFLLRKFRTMTNERGEDGELLPDAERLTRFGQMLRSTSLDELPELLNVLKGDMSLVGPRPLLERYLPLYSEEQARRHDVRPGITGWAQVNGRNTVGWEERFEMDVWYVDNASLLLDLEILLKTVVQVLKRDGISADGEATMSMFTGGSQAS